VVNSEKELILDGEKDNFNVSRPTVISPSFICPLFHSIFFYLLTSDILFRGCVALFCLHFFSPPVACSSLCSVPAETQSNLPGNNFINTSELSYFERDKWYLPCNQLPCDLSIFLVNPLTEIRRSRRLHNNTRDLSRIISSSRRPIALAETKFLKAVPVKITICWNVISYSLSENGVVYLSNMLYFKVSCVYCC